MLALAIALLLIVGVSAVFRMAGQAVGSGQTVSTAVRNYRAAAAVMTEDFRNCATDSPAFVIYSTRIHRNLSFAEAIRGTTGYVSPRGYAAKDTTWSGVCYWDPLLQFDYNYPRIQRTDMVRFFARGMYRRQTANEGSFTSTTTSSEAFITYGHLNYWSRSSLPDYGSTGADTPCVWWELPERTSYTASEWTLGRNVILLKDTASLQASGETYIRRESDTNPTAYPARPDPAAGEYEWKPVPWPWWYPDPLNPSAGWQPTFNLSPLCCGSSASSPRNNYLFPDQIQDSRYDIAETTIDGFRQIVATAKARQALFPLPPPGHYLEPVRIVRWWHPLVFKGQDFIGGSNPPDVRYTGGGHPRFINSNEIAITGWALNVAYTVGTVVSSSGVNYQCLVAHTSSSATKPPTGASWNTYWQALPAGMRYTVTHPPRYSMQSTMVFLGADMNAPIDRVGDHIDPWRFGCDPDVVSPLTSTKTANAAPYFLQYCSQFGVEYAGDYLTQTDDGTATAATPDGKVDFMVRTVNGRAIKEIRWYGMPRDVDGDGVIPGWITGRTTNQLTDVVPLRDVVRTIPAHSTPPPDAENPTNYFYGMPHEKDVEGLFSPPQADYGMPTGNSTVIDRLLKGRYVCVWTNDVPAMIRIWMQVDDPTDRMQMGQRLELVFRLK